MIRTNQPTNSFVFCLFKRLVLVIVGIAMSNTAWGFETTSSGKYAKATVTVNPSAKGCVYVDTLATPLAENAVVWPNTLEHSIANDGVSSKIFGFEIFANNTITFNLYAKDRANEGYVWGGWFNADTLVVFDRIATTTITAEGTQNNPTTALFEARWLQPLVTKVSPTAINFGEINDPTTPIEAQNAVFTIQDYAGQDNYNYTAENNCIIIEDGIVFDSEGHTYTLPVSYTPKMIHGTHTGLVRLSSVLYPEDMSTDLYKEVTTTITENYKPDFEAQYNTAQNPYVFAETPVGSYTNSPAGALRPADNTRNYAALAAAATFGVDRTVWTAKIQGEQTGYKGLFVVEGADANGVIASDDPIVKFNADENKIKLATNATKTFTAQLVLTCTYYDKAGAAIASEQKISYLSATAKQTNEVILSFDVEPDGQGKKEYEFPESFIGQTIATDIALVRSNVLETEQHPITLQWISGNANNLFVAQYSDGNVKISINNDVVVCGGPFEAVLQAKGISRLDNTTQVTDRLTVSLVSFNLSTPQVTAAGGNLLVTFTWAPVAGATGYKVYAANGTTLLATLTGKDNTTYAQTVKNNGDSFSCRVQAINTTTQCESVLSEVCTGIAKLESIYPSNAASTGLTTGTEGTTQAQELSNGFPYKEERNIDVSAAFDGQVAIMDRLYIFGTSQKSGNAWQTPCYVYAKNANNAQYDLVETISNVNTDSKNGRFKIAATNNMKLYFTGYCPYGSTGGKDDEGVVHIYGGNSSAKVTVDLYLDNLQLYADSKKSGTIEFTLSDVQNDADGVFFAQGSGAAFVFQSSSLNANYPLAIDMHIRGNNILDAVPGTTYNVGIARGNTYYVQDAPTHYSSPIAVYATTTNQQTALTFDDIWSNKHTNGSLALTEKDADNNAGMSIDLGNANTKCTFNGGQYTFQDIVSTYRTSTYQDADATVSINVYGLKYNNATKGSGSTTINCGAHVALKDGTFNANSNLAFYASTLAVDGGSYNQPIQHYKTTVAPETSLYDSNDKKLKRADISYQNQYGGIATNGAANFTNFAKMMDDLFPDYGVNLTADNGSTYHYPLSVYYVGGVSYGHASVTPKDNHLYFMLPVMDCSSLHMAWQFCAPDMSANIQGTMMDLGGSIEKIDGCIHHLNSKYTIDNLLYTSIDEYTQNSLADYYLYGQNVTITLNQDKQYSTINNTNAYTIQDKVYMLMPIEAAKWTMFVAPFDVKSIYVIEAYPEKQLLKDFGTSRGKIRGEKNISNARKAQSQRIIDLYTRWYYEERGIGEPHDFFNANSQVDVNGDGKVEPYGQFVLDWMDYELNTNTKISQTGNYMPSIEKLQHYYEQKNAAGEVILHNAATANYYLYATGANWPYNTSADSDVDKFDATWQPVAQNAAKIMEKGKVYIMQFPHNIMTGSYDPVNEYSYWEGKYILIESTAGPHTINGSNYNMLGTNTIQANGSYLAQVYGNATFADINLGNSSLTMLKMDKVNNGGRDNYNLTIPNTSLVKPTEGFIITNLPATINQKALTINYKTGVVSYETLPEGEDKPGVSTGVPTIMGDVTLLVEPTQDGLVIKPLTSQQVMIYTATGQLVFNDYIDIETSVTLPTGVYVVHGEHERIKTIKK